MLCLPVFTGPFEKQRTESWPTKLALNGTLIATESLVKLIVLGEFRALCRKSPQAPESKSLEGKWEMKYATGPGNGVYHLVLTDSAETLCGLRVSRLKSAHLLHLESDISSEGVICKHCERIKDNNQNHGQ